MLCLSPPAAPPLLATLRHAAASVDGRSTLSIKLNHLFPLTPLASADNMRSVQTDASTHDQSRPWVSAPCLAKSGTGGAGICFSSSFTSPPSCLPSLGVVLLPAPPVRLAPCPKPLLVSTMQALTSATVTGRQISPLNSHKLPDIPPPTTSIARTSTWLEAE